MSRRNPPESQKTSVIHLLHRARQCADVLLQNRILDLDLTPTQVIILAAVAAKAGLSQMDLTQATGIDRSTMADVVRRMTKNGLVRRKRTRGDARTYAIDLTDLGRLAVKKLGPTTALVGNELLAVLPAERRASFIESLRKIIDRLASEKVHAAGAADTKRLD